MPPMASAWTFYLAPSLSIEKAQKAKHLNRCRLKGMGQAEREIARLGSLQLCRVVFAESSHEKHVLFSMQRSDNLFPVPSLKSLYHSDRPAGDC
jgi:ribosomal protein S14